MGEADIDVIEARFSAGVKGHHEYHSRYNVAPSETMPIVVPHEIPFMHWGYRPAWANKEVINARIESLATKPYFREAKHCLVPATGFYEWKRDNGHKVPYFFHVPDNPLFAFAGVYNERGYAIVTTASQGVVADIHTRMPVILSKDSEQQWLTDTVAPEAQPLVCHEVGSAVNSPANDWPELLAHV